MTCNEASRLIGPFVDDELDVRSAVDVEGHLARCAACAQEKSEITALRDTVRERLPRFDPPDGLEDRLFRATRVVALPKRRIPWRGAALVAAAACATLVAASTLHPARDAAVEEIVDAHVRSLQAQHLTDVASSDQHTVKPWFQGRIDFAVPARDFADRGFVLAGGRLDVLSGHPAAALVYRRRQHVLNLFVAPASTDEPRRDFSLRGYRIATWTQDGLRYRLVSDVPASESDELISLLRGADSSR
ncbi:MAG: anti-sigma factor [Deltaproteobacteria bacterium]|nr:MAG: anti-sigma factor [Deltaproteobacteria bacterium]TMB35970.1 MAG: anti-sigma factor [Deltaproteobacteria bacterium]